MARFPPAPPVAALAAISPIWRELPSGTLLWRVYFRSGPHPTTWGAFRSFGPTGACFDHHTYPKRVQDRAILYAARQGRTAFAEVFQQTRVVDVTTHDPALVALRLTASIRLLALTGHWPTTAGASMAINTGSHAKARDWSRAIYAAYPTVAGLWYCSSMDANEPCAALYDRAQIALPAEPTFHAALRDQRLRPLIDRVANALNYMMVP